MELNEGEMIEREDGGDLIAKNSFILRDGLLLLALR